jgi:hypothetical protein
MKSGPPWPLVGSSGLTLPQRRPEIVDRHRAVYLRHNLDFVVARLTAGDCLSAKFDGVRP